MDEVTVGLAALERTPLFAGLDREHLEDVLSVGQRVSYQPGQAIVERGDPGDAMYVVVSGAAEVDVGGRYHRLERGDFFGEMAVLAGKPREATVKAVEPLEALRIPGEEFQTFLSSNPQIAVGMLKSLVERLREVQDRLDTWVGGVW
jgi:monovalent cation:H+ antiporter, CPA1 family